MISKPVNPGVDVLTDDLVSVMAPRSGVYPARDRRGLAPGTWPQPGAWRQVVDGDVEQYHAAIRDYSWGHAPPEQSEKVPFQKFQKIMKFSYQPLCRPVGDL